jgi:hypothetical protein
MGIQTWIADKLNASNDKKVAEMLNPAKPQPDIVERNAPKMTLDAQQACINQGLMRNTPLDVIEAGCGAKPVPTTPSAQSQGVQVAQR